MNEKGYCACQDGKQLLKEKTVTGKAHSIDIPIRCSRGQPKALVHSHPGGDIRPSSQDMETSRKTKLPVCVVVHPVNGNRKVRCYKAV